jgi:hypothetical protein
MLRHTMAASRRTTRFTPAPARRRALFPARPCALAVSALLALPLALSAQIVVNQPIPPVASIHVDAAHSTGPAIPRTIFGTFLEPIGNSTYNGLWAEILENPSLEMGLWDTNHIRQMIEERPSLARASQLDLPLPWEPLNPGQGNRYELRTGDAANSWMSLRIFGVPGEPTGIRQQVWLPVHRTLSYDGSFYARHVSGPSGLTLSLRQHTATPSSPVPTSTHPPAHGRNTPSTSKSPKGNSIALTPPTLSSRSKATRTSMWTSSR